jgi:uncharacterized protein (TIGR02145 family)
MREIKIEEQIWTIDNLDITTYRNGDLIPKIEDVDEWKNLKTGAWCYFENNPDNNIHGKLYNYHAIIDPRGLAPEGYRIPQHYDWLLLQKFGSRLKSKSDWQEKDELDFYIPFNAKPVGYRDSYGRFCYKNEAVGWWASPEKDVKNQGNIAHWLYQNDPQLGWKPFIENDGFYVRCLKETYKAIDLYFNDNLHLHYEAISIKYNKSTTFQEVLNMLYEQFLKGTVNSYSYGIEWIIQIYDGEHVNVLNKLGNSDIRIFDEILSSQYRNFRLIISRP